ncbi:hypothetical protein ACFFMS_26495 [Ectobacillus funiculus]|uniref:Uncharacterized protein n=1 Tax=Ectobacillus funiculus TaxID=137993 RepID=A0ABV5WMI8_9BACI
MKQRLPARDKKHANGVFACFFALSAILGVQCPCSVRAVSCLTFQVQDKVAIVKE